MIYRVKAILAFVDEDEARDFYHDAELALPKATPIKPEQSVQELGVIRLEQCFHDQDPTKPCITLAEEYTVP